MSYFTDYRTVRAELRAASEAQEALNKRQRAAGLHWETDEWHLCNDRTGLALDILSAMHRHALKVAWSYLRILVFGFLAYVSGGLTIWWLGTGWWAVLIAASSAALVPSPVLMQRREVPRAGS